MRDLAARWRYRARHARAATRRSLTRYVLPICLVGASVLVVRPSDARFTSVTANSADVLSSTSVAITNERAGSVVFTGVNSLIPGDTGTKCVKVTYTGTTSAPVKLYASAYTDTGLATALHLTVEEGGGGDYSSCTGFARTAYVVNDQTFASVFNPSGVASRRTYATGLGGTWAPATNPSTKTYRFTYALPPATANSVAGTGVSVTFTWEAQST